jgi:nucleotide-binding universal stress UspA family protein
MRFQKVEEKMFRRVVVCLDGSRLAERVIPYARGLAESAKAKLKILRIVDDGEDFTGVSRYVETWSKSLRCEAEAVNLQHEVASTLLAELWNNPDDLPALTTRGHKGLMEPMLGSTALGVVRKLGRPVFLFHPFSGEKPVERFEIKSVIAALDGSRYSENILPFAAELAKALRLDLELVQALPDGRDLPREIKNDVLEDAYLAPRAYHLKKDYGLNVRWDVLHGAAAKAICSYVRGRQGAVLAMTTHARGPLEQALLGSVASACVSRAGVPVLIDGSYARENPHELAIDEAAARAD